MSNQKIMTTVFHFLGGAVIPATTNPCYGLVKKITGSAVVSKVLGAAAIALEATNEAQNACLYADDNLAFDIDDIKQFRAWVKATVAMGTAAKWRVGLANARNDNPDSITESILFGGAASGVITVEADDGTNEVAATSTGIAIGSTFKKLVIDFSKGFHAQSPPSLSVGGKSAVHFSAEDAHGTLNRVCEGTRFNMSAATGGLQPFVQVQKTAATDLGTLVVARIEIDHVVLA
jgi:hypothetical protein